MDEAQIVLQALYDELSQAEQSDVGPLELTASTLSAMDGNVNLIVNVRTDAGSHPNVAHCHIVARLGTDESGHLDACVVGIDADRASGLRAAGKFWVDTVAGPVFSLVHARPVLGAQHFDGSVATGVTGCHGFTGPMSARMFDQPFDFETLAGIAVFDYAAELAPPGILHLAKVTLNANLNGWSRNIEIDGHLASYSDNPWEALRVSPPQGILTQFAVFHYADRTEAMIKRQRLDDAIRRFVSAFHQTNDTAKAADVLNREGVDGDLVHRISSLAPLAFGRVVFHGLGMKYSPYYTRIKSDGSLEEGLHLMHDPVFARSAALSEELMNGEFLEAFKGLALTGAEINAINSALNAGSNPKDLKLSPSLIPDRDASRQAVAQAVEQLQNQMQRAKLTQTPRPWWRFW